MKYYIIAGEASGDLHGSNLLKALKLKDPDAEFRFWGGDQMESIGGKAVKHIKDLAFMGFVEVVANLRTILSNISFCKKDILSFAPDALILIDYPGFNLRIADFAQQASIPVHYYISPQIWAWKQNRVHKIKRTVSEMYCILPFEKAFYKRFGMDVHYVGHPLLDAIHNFKSNADTPEAFRKAHNLSDQKILALLPGSRVQEIKAKLPIMLEAARRFSDLQILVAGAPNISEKFYADLAGSTPIKVIPNRTYDLLNQAHAAMVTSGTATLETALFNVPQVVCYKGNRISVAIARRVIKVDYISLVNLIMEKEVVKELIQDELTPENIEKGLRPLIEEGSEQRTQLQESCKKLTATLGGGGASEKAASLLVEKLRK